MSCVSLYLQVSARGPPSVTCLGRCCVVRAGIEGSRAGAACGLHISRSPARAHHRSGMWVATGVRVATHNCRMGDMTHFGFSGERALPGARSSLRGASRRSLSEPRRSRSLSRPRWLHTIGARSAGHTSSFSRDCRMLRAHDQAS